MDLVPANHFTYEQLVDAYNQTRIDYVVPMPMNVARMREYSRVYDIDLARSVVALEDNIMQGLGMLGVRDNRTWITRLGVLTSGPTERGWPRNYGRTAKTILFIHMRRYFLA